jgi:hypothetical protein
MDFEIDQNELNSLPEPEHLETVFQGAIDTVAGNEGLTYAQHYVHSCLQTSSIISSRTGTEGFFESVGNGLKAVWEYIKKMFSSIWSFFFGSGDDTAEKESKKAEDTIKKAEKAVADVVHPPTVAKAEEIAHAATTAIVNTPAADVTHEVQKAQDEVKQIIAKDLSKGSTSSDSEKRHAAAVIAKKMPVINQKKVTNLQARIRKLVDSSNEFYGAFTENSHEKLFKGTELEQTYEHFMVGARDSAVPGATEKVSAKSRAMRTPEEGLVVLQALEVLRKAYAADIWLVNSRKSELSGSMKKLDEKIKGHEARGNNPEKLHAILERNKIWFDKMVKLSHQLKSGLEAITHFAKEITKIFGVSVS